MISIQSGREFGDIWLQEIEGIDSACEESDYWIALPFDHVAEIRLNLGSGHFMCIGSLYWSDYGPEDSPEDIVYIEWAEIARERGRHHFTKTVECMQAAFKTFFGECHDEELAKYLHLGHEYVGENTITGLHRVMLSTVPITEEIVECMSQRTGWKNIKEVLNCRQERFQTGNDIER